MSVFQGLSSGKGRAPCMSASMPRSGTWAREIPTPPHSKSARQRPARTTRVNERVNENENRLINLLLTSVQKGRSGSQKRADAGTRLMAESPPTAHLQGRLLRAGTIQRGISVRKQVRQQ